MHNERDAGEVDPLQVGRAIEAAWNGSGSEGQRNDLPPIDLSDHECRHIGNAALATRPPAPEDAGMVERVVSAISPILIRREGAKQDTYAWAEEATRAALAALSRLDGEKGADMVLVPREPTEAMLLSGNVAGGYDAYRQEDNTSAIWTAMLDAASKGE